MSAVLSDPLWPLVATLAATVDEVLTEYDAATCRTFVAPGAAAPWDVCCSCDRDHEGQAWVAVQQVAPTGPFPAQSTQPLRCRPADYLAQIVVGVLRCATTVDDAGNVPTVDQLTDEAVKVSRDRTLIRYAVLCRWAEDADLLPGRLVLGPWQPLGPQGGCVGGQTSLTIAVS